MQRRQTPPPAPPAPVNTQCEFCDNNVTLPPGLAESGATPVCDDCQDRLGLDRCHFCGTLIDDDNRGGLCEDHQVTCSYSDDCDKLVHPDPAGPRDAMCDEHAEQWERESTIAHDKQFVEAHAPIKFRKDYGREPNLDDSDDVNRLVDIGMGMVSDIVTRDHVREVFEDDE